MSDTNEAPQFDTEYSEAQEAISSATSVEDMASAMTNYVLPLFKSLQDQFESALTDIEQQLNNTDADEVISNGREAVSVLLALALSMLRHNGWFDEATGNPSANTPAEIRKLADAGMKAAQAFFEAADEYAASQEDDDESADDEGTDEDAEVDGNEGGA